jgi:hypothetical protein
MTVKEYLMQIRQIEGWIKQKQGELAEYREYMYSVSGIDYSKPKIDCSAINSSGFGVEKYEELIAEVKQQIETYCKLKHRIIDELQVFSVSEPFLAEILQKRYIDYKQYGSFEQIAVAMNYNYYYIIKMHGKALVEFGKGLDI